MRPYNLVKDFNNWRVGYGVFKINNVAVGFFNGDLTVKTNLESFLFKAGTPQYQVGEIPTRYIFEITVPVVEINPANFCNAMGIQQSALRVWDGASDLYDDYWTDVLASKQFLTVKKLGWGSVGGFLLDHGGVVTGGGDEPVFMDETGVTTYTKNVDYILDPAIGVVYVVPGGGIDIGDKIACKYKCIPPKGTELAFKAGGVLPGQYPMELEGIDAKTNKRSVAYMPLGEAMGTLQTQANALWLINMTVAAVYSNNPAHAAYPMGYINFDIESSAT